MPSLLAVDLGLRCGLALYGQDGRLRWYRSSNFGNRARLKRGVPAVLEGAEGLTWVYAEGDRRLAEIWEREAARRGARLRLVSAETWRQALLLPRQQRSGLAAKRHAGHVARQIIAWSGARRPTSLRHDAAEAILIGLYASLQVGWLPRLPPSLDSSQERR